MLSDLQIQSLRVQLRRYVDRVRAGEPEAHDEMLAVVEAANPEDMEWVQDILDEAAAAYAAHCQVPAPAKEQERPFMKISTAAKEWERLGNPEMAKLVRRGPRAIREKDVQTLKNFLDAAAETRCGGELLRFMLSAQRRAAYVILDDVACKASEARSLCQEAQRASSRLAKAGLWARHRQARREALFHFNNRGILALQQLIERDELPDSVRAIFSPEKLQSMNRPKTAAIRLLSAIREYVVAPIGEDEAACHNFHRQGNTTPRTSKMLSDRERKDRDTARRARQLERSKGRQRKNDKR